MSLTRVTSFVTRTSWQLVQPVAMAEWTALPLVLSCVALNALGGVRVRCPKVRDVWLRRRGRHSKSSPIPETAVLLSRTTSTSALLLVHVDYRVRAKLPRSSDSHAKSMYFKQLADNRSARRSSRKDRFLLRKMGFPPHLKVKFPHRLALPACRVVFRRFSGHFSLSRSSQQHPYQRYPLAF